MKKIYFFTSDEVFNKVFHQYPRLVFLHFSSVEQLQKFLNQEKSNPEKKILLSFGIGEIVPLTVLAEFSLSINIHSASYEYPGRDPHHYAIYEKAKFYGATAHFMEASVDAGPIIKYKNFTVLPEMSSVDLLKKANDCGFELLKELLDDIVNQKTEFSALEVKWRACKFKRKDLENYSRIYIFDKKNEIDHKYKSFQANIKYKNLYIDFFGYRFRFEEKLKNNTYTNNFTFSFYKKFIQKIKNMYSFILYDEAKKSILPSILWRHDIDISVHKAYKIAEIENKENIKSTFFLMLGNRFYDIRDKEINKLIIKIKSMGHSIGLHYDFEYLSPNKISYIDKFLISLADQKKEIEKILGFEVNTFSFHNPSTIDPFLLNEINRNYMYFDMINAYSDVIKEKFKYLSDSNGIWKYEKPEDVICPKVNPYLQILTHPEWWSEHSITPREKVIESLIGRARSVLNWYDAALKAQNIENF